MFFYLTHYVFSWSTLLVVLFFGGSIFVHELGHFLAARRRGVKVERFSIGFGPAICSWRGRDGVEYRLAWLPLGGYVLLPQLADLGVIEGRSEIEAARLPPVGYAAKMVVFIAGAWFNILLAFALACVLWVIGQPQPDDLASTRIGYIMAQIDQSGPSPAVAAGLRVGDTIRAVDGHAVRNWNDMFEAMITSSSRGEDGQPRAVFTVERDGRALDIAVRPRLAGEDKLRKVGIAPDYELVVADVAPRSPAAQAGFQKGDSLLRLDAVPIRNEGPYLDYLEASHGRPITALVLRDGREIALTVPARDPKAAAGLGLALAAAIREVHRSPFVQLNDQLTTTFRTLGSLLNPRSDIGLSKMSGPVGIVHIFHNAAESGLASLLMFAVLVNVNLAIFNLLPIPVLDGGQMLFATIGRLRGKALPLNFILTTQSVFLVLLFSMILYVSVFDVRRWGQELQAERAVTVAK